MLSLKVLFKSFKKQEYPNRCPFCKKKKFLAKGWARFPNHKLTNRVQAAKPLFLALTDQAEQEWFDYIICFGCFRIIWHRLNSHMPDREIPLPSIQELTGWKDPPVTPIVIYDKEGNPVYGTRRSKEIYQKN